MKTIDQNPTTIDAVQFFFTTTNASGTLVDPVTLDSITFYYIQRSFFDGNQFVDTITEPEGNYTTYFNNANPVIAFGSDGFPAWDSGNPSAALVMHESTGTFSLVWQPSDGAGDYYVCWKWTYSGNQTATFYQFYIGGDTSETTSLPIHQTAEGKYETLLDKYLPAFMKLKLTQDDITPDIVNRYNQAIAKMFTEMENLINPMVDFLDSNATPSYMLPYLANNFGVKLKSRDTTLWRRQIKNAVPLYKKKGTLGGLTQAFSDAGITLNSFTMLWQVISPYTWQEGIKVQSDGQTIFTLEKLALPYDTYNFYLALRPSGTATYLPLDFNSYVTLSNSGGVTTMTWIGEEEGSPIILSQGDFINIIYKVNNVVDQSMENYIRTLPLSDQRDEAVITYPLRNWNVRLIAENDSMFPVICTAPHSYVEPIIYGKVRTEFPYSEAIYNMEEYNGSIRDSYNPCDIDKSFIDDCSCCRSSRFNLSLSIEKLSNERISEANQIINDFKPFHLIPQTITYAGTISDIVIPPLEEINMYIQYSGGETYNVSAQDNFSRHMMLSGGQNSSFNAPLRNQLATPTTVVNTTGTAKNTAYVIYATHLRFDSLGISTSNLLEILSGTAAGNYTATYIDPTTLKVNQGSPSTLSYPLEAGQHNWRLSNIIYTNGSSSIYQDNIFTFSDTSLHINQYQIVPGWVVTISNGTNPGNYTINGVLPNNSFTIASWPGSNISNLNYQIKDSFSNVVVSGTTGSIALTLRGRVELPDNVQTGFGVVDGNYVLYSGTQYYVTGFNTGSKLYINGYNSGNVVGSASVKILKRLVDNSYGFLDVYGATLTTSINYESGLGILNGQNQSKDGLGDVDSHFKENYLVLIGGNYYRITNWTTTTLTLSGPKTAWGTSGTSVPYSIILYNKTLNVTVSDHTYRKIDRSGNETITIQTETVASMMSYNGSDFSDSVNQSENIQITIQQV